MVRSITWDRTALAFASLYAFAALACIASAVVTVPDFPLPPWIGAVAFVPAALAWVTAVRPVVVLDDTGIWGLTGGRRLAWDEVADATVRGTLLVVTPRHAAVGIRAVGQFFRWRPGAPSNALSAALDPAVVADAEALIQRCLARPGR